MLIPINVVFWEKYNLYMKSNSTGRSAGINNMKENIVKHVMIIFCMPATANAFNCIFQFNSSSQRHDAKGK